MESGVLFITWLHLFDKTQRKQLLSFNIHSTLTLTPSLSTERLLTALTPTKMAMLAMPNCTIGLNTGRGGTSRKM